MNDEVPTAEAMAVSGERIVAVGNSREVLSLVSLGTRVVDLGGGYVIPGFNDSHMHLLGWGRAMNLLDLTSARSCEDLIRLGRASLDGSASGWIIGRGYKDSLFPPSDFPTRETLDAISTERPIVFVRVCGHVCVANSMALKLAGMDGNYPDPPGGEICRDPATGEPNGVLRESAISLVMGIVPEPAVDEWKPIILNAAQQAVSLGLTTVQTNDIDGAETMVNRLEAYHQLINEGLLPLRVNLQVGTPHMSDLGAFLDVRERYSSLGTRLVVGPIKLFADGSLGGRTALLREDYSDQPGMRGIAVYRQEELDQLVAAADSAGLQVAVHAIGDGAMDLVLKSFAKLCQGGRRPRRRPRIIHCQIAAMDILARMASLGVVADIQPFFVSSDYPFVESRVGRERSRTSYAWRTMQNMGIHLAGSSDCPVESPNPMYGVYAAATRKDLSGNPPEGWHSGETLSIYDSIRLFTIGASYAVHEEGIKGTLSPGRLADFVVFPKNPLTVDPCELPSMPVLRTYVGGQCVYER